MTKTKIRPLLLEIYTWLEFFVSILPGKSGVLIRRGFYKMFLRKCGSRLSIGQYVRMQRPDCIEIGQNVTINDRGWIAANRDGIIVIKDDTLIGPCCIIHSGNHKFQSSNLLVRQQGYSFEKIEIGEDVWIGARVTILQGVKIGDRTVAAAGCVITKNVDSNYIVAGIPAKVIGKR